MSAMSNTLENEFLDYFFTTEAVISRPTNWYVELHTGAPGEDGTSNPVANSGDYARAAITFSAAASGVTSNSNTVTFNVPTANWGTITHYSIWTASGYGAGTCLAYGALSTPPVIAANIGTAITIPPGSIELTAA